MTALGLLLADSSNGDFGGHMNGWGGGWMWLWGVSMMVLFVVVILWGLRGMASTAANPSPHDPGARAREILAERYAKGDLDTEEYRERVSELQ